MLAPPDHLLVTHVDRNGLQNVVLHDLSRD